MMDALDLRLIRLLQDDARAQYSKLARATGASEATIKRRVESMIQRGIITPAMLPDLKSLGYGVSAIVGINIDVHRLDEIAQAVSELPEATVVTTTIGRYDLIVFVATQSLESLTDLVADTIAAIPGVRTTETFVTPKTYKAMRDWRMPDDVAGHAP